MLKTATRLRSLLLALLYIYLFVYPWSILLVSFDRVPEWGTWMGSVLLILQGSLMGLWLRANYGRPGTYASLLLLILSWLVEHIGATTGFPFGSYTYTNVLLPKIADVVPLAIPFAWLMVVPASLGITEYVMNTTAPFLASTSNQNHRLWLKMFGAASFTVLLDMTIEPVSVHVNGYWEWKQTDFSYYGVPISNFIAWWILSLLLVWMISMFQQLAQKKSANAQTNSILFPWLPPLLYILNLTMFVLVNMAHAQRSAALIGWCALCYFALVWSKPRMQRRLTSTEQSKTAIMKDER
jgi:bisanhydrobacterioruberin hydratase